MKKHRNRPWMEPLLWWLIGPGVILLVLGFLLSYRYDETHLLWIKITSIGASELGFTLLIAATIYAVFEERVKRDDAKGIAAFLYGIETDTHYFRMIEDYIIRCPYYRYHTTITYKFEDKIGESYLVSYMIEYDVRNVSKVRQKFRVSGEVDTRPIYGTDAPPQWTLGVIGAEVTQKKETKQAVLSCSPSASSPHSMRFESEDFVIKPAECAHVKIEHKILKHDHDMDVWHSAIPCSGVKLRIAWLKEWGLRFAYEALHPNADDLAAEEGVMGAECWKELSLQEPFMARHGLRFSWSSDGAQVGAGGAGPSKSDEPMADQAK